MFRFIVSRALLMLPLLAVISLLAFLLAQGSPGNPVERMLQQQAAQDQGSAVQNFNHDEEIRKIRNKLGLDIPLFYFSVGTMADIDSIFNIEPIESRGCLQKMARETGQPDSVIKWFSLQKQLTESIKININDTTKELGEGRTNNLLRALQISEKMLSNMQRNEQEARIDSLTGLLSLIPEATEERRIFERAVFTFRGSYASKRDWLRYVPTISMHGKNNQYHFWLFGRSGQGGGVIRGDFGISYRDGTPVQDRISKAFKWTICLSLSSMVLAFLLSIPLGLYSGLKPGSAFDKIVSGFVFSMYALPGFFVASMLLLLFANPDVLDWFPASGVKDPETFNPDAAFLQRAWHYLPYFVLPIAALTYAQLAFISRQVRSATIEALQSEYVFAARAFGLKNSTILLKHVLPNILFPLITLAGQSLPLLFGGSVIIETIFSIPGMGMELYESVIAMDYPMIVAIFSIIGFLTMLGYLLSDILYALADPRVRQSKEFGR